ncbi:MAG TPA: glycosyltransferase [Actinomycetota bacterium]
MDISVVIATLGRPEPLRRALESIAAARPGPLEVLVVDGDEGAGARPVVEEWSAGGLPVRHVVSPRGLTTQRNVGVREAGGEVVVFLDDDAVVLRADFFEVLADVYRDDAIAGATGVVVEAEARRFGGRTSRMRRAVLGGGRDGTFSRFGYPRRLRDQGRAVDVELMQGCLMTVRRDLAEELGFDESLPGYGLMEDEDFSYRLSRRGRIRHDPRLAVHHDNTGFLSQDQRAFGRLVVTTRAYLFRKNFVRTPLARLQFGLLVLALVGHRLMNREWAGARGVLEGALDVWRARR